MRFYRYWILVISFILLTSCASTKKIEDVTYVSTKKLSERGIVFLKNGQYAKARVLFSSALKQDPKDCQLHFLNALTYQLEGKTGNYRLLDLAASGHRSAIKFCPNDSWPYYYLGLIELQKKNFRQSEHLFYQAVKNSKGQGSIEFLQAFIKSAEKANDYTTVNQLIVQLKTIDPNSPLINKLKKIRKVIARHKGAQRASYHTSGSKSSFSKSSYSKAAVVKDDRKQVFIDAVLILSQETLNRNRGVNLLNGLQLQYGNNIAVNNFSTSNFAKYANAATRAGFDISSSSLPSLDYATLVTHAISIPDITYNLNIFNDVNEFDKILSRPTLLARDGKTSTYFVGNRIIVGVSGLNTGQIESVPIGLTMKVTPTFLKNGSMDLDIEVGKEVVISTSSQLASNLQSVATTSKQDTNTSVNLRFGETVILSALSEGTDTSEDNRTPGLADLPLVRYLFSNKTDGKRNTSILVLLTPHKATSFQHDDEEERNIQQSENTKDFYNKFVNPFTDLNNILTNLSKSDIYTVFTGFYDQFYSPEVLSRAVDYTHKNIDQF